MALSDIEMIRVITQDNGNLPFLAEGDYILDDEYIEGILALYNNDIMLATRMACYAICNWIVHVPTREVVGEVELWNESSKNYMKSLQMLLADKSLFSLLPSGIMPYAAGVSNADLLSSLRDLDNPRALSWLAFRTEPNYCEC